MLSTQSSAAQLVAMDTETVESVGVTHLFTRNCSQETVRPDFKNSETLVGDFVWIKRVKKLLMFLLPKKTMKPECVRQPITWREDFHMLSQ